MPQSSMPCCRKAIHSIRTCWTRLDPSKDCWIEKPMASLWLSGSNSAFHPCRSCCCHLRRKLPMSTKNWARHWGTEVVFWISAIGRFGRITGLPKELLRCSLRGNQ